MLCAKGKLQQQQQLPTVRFVSSGGGGAPTATGAAVQDGKGCG